MLLELVRLTPSLASQDAKTRPEKETQGFGYGKTNHLFLRMFSSRGSGAVIKGAA